MEKLTLKERIDHMDGLSQAELEQLLNDYKKQTFPVWRRGALFGYHVAMFGFLAYYTLNCKQLNKKFFNVGNNFSKLNMFKIGTIQALTFTSIYVIGGYFATGMKNPLEYFRTVNNIKGKLHAPTYRHDKGLQQALLYPWLQQFNLPKQVVDKVRESLQKDKQELITSGKLSQRTIQILKNQVSQDDSVLVNILGLATKTTEQQK